MTHAVVSLLALLLFIAPAGAEGPVACGSLYDANVARVVDGDTVEVSIELWPGLTLAKRVRLDGYNAPEASGLEKAFGTRATAALGRLLPPGARVYLESRGAEKYGRLLAVLVLPATPAETVVDRLVREGWGVRWDGRGKRPTPWLDGAAYPLASAP